MKPTNNILELERKLGERLRARPWVETQQPPRVEYITPAYPKQAIDLARSWERDNKKPALAIAVRRTSALACGNCDGAGEVYLKLCTAGPYSAPVMGKDPLVFFEGNERHKRGWYTYDKTRAYACPICTIGNKS